MKYLRLSALLCGLVVSALAAPFGKVVPIGGHVADLALDSRRNVLYIANFGANRIDVMSLADTRLGQPIYVSAQPATLAVSPDGRFLVIGHYANWSDGTAIKPSITILDLDGDARQTLTLAYSPLAVAFGNGSSAFVVTTGDYELLDPLSGTVRILATGSGLIGDSLPVTYPKFPPEIVEASTGVSGDGDTIYALAQAQGVQAVIQFRVPEQRLGVVGITSAPPLGPRTISANLRGDLFLAGWALLTPSFVNIAQFPYPTGKLNVGAHAFDWSRNLIYAQIPAATTPAPTGGATPAAAEPPSLQVVEPDNLTVVERLQLKENLGGKSVFSPDMGTLYAASDSGVTVLPIGTLDRAPRVAAVEEDVIFRGNACDRRSIVRQLNIIDRSGAHTDFTISGGGRGIRISPAAGTTPARVQIEVDPTVFMSEKGTVAVQLSISSSGAVNLPMPVRLLINTKEPVQRGALFSVPGTLVDVLSDPVRDQFYVIRQDRNLVLVYKGSTFEQIAVLRTGNTPTQMAITLDNRYLMIGADNSQIAHVYDLETLQPSYPIIFPPGHYPRSIAVSSRSILAAVRSSSSPQHKIDRIDFDARIATELPTLGMYQNSINPATVLMATPGGSSIVAAMPDGNVLLYNAVADTFVAARKDLASPSGALAAISDEMFLVDNTFLNSSLVPVSTLESDSGASSGFTYADGAGIRTTVLTSSTPGTIERVDASTLNSFRPTSMSEAPIAPKTILTPVIGQIGQTILPFLRTLAPLANRSGIVSLSTSGITLLKWDYDAALARPVISSVVNAADGSPLVAPGGLIFVYGSDLSPVTGANTEVPVPTTLGDSCLTVNGTLLPLFMASPGVISAQLPFTEVGGANMVIRSPGGTGDPFKFQILSGAPAIFRNGSAGSNKGLATVFRAINDGLVTLSNPIHPEDQIVVFLTGLGQTSPAIDAGAAGPSPPAMAVNQPEVTLGKTPLQVWFAGLTPGQVGVYQINAKVPFSVSTGMEVPLTITQAGQSTALNVRVVK